MNSISHPVLQDAYIVDALRTPVGKLNGSLRYWRAHQLGAVLIRRLLDRNGIGVAEIDEVIVGNAAGPGGNLARVALLEAGVSHEVPGVTVDRQCGSGLEAIIQGVRLVQSGAAKTVIAGGIESATTAPLRTDRWTGQTYERAAFTPDWMDDPEMGNAAENVAAKYGITRLQQDEFAFASHMKATDAQQRGQFDAERLTLPLKPPERCSEAPLTTANSDENLILDDQCVRADCSLERLSTLSPVFQKNGTVTAGNACPVNDGASMVLISSTCDVEPNTLFTGDSPLAAHRPCLRFVDARAAGVEPELLGSGPIPATLRLLGSTGHKIDSIDRVEFNEAFAAQVLACITELEIDPDRVNLQGGALAIGHPYGASGAILVTRLLQQLRTQQFGLATIGIGGGLGLSALFEAV